MNTDSGRREFTLYGTSACHLCEVAGDMLVSLPLAQANISLEKVDIVGSDALFEAYGTRIPVLRHPDGRELGWPFSADELAAFIRS